MWDHIPVKMDNLLVNINTIIDTLKICLWLQSQFQVLKDVNINHHWILSHGYIMKKTNKQHNVSLPNFQKRLMVHTCEFWLFHHNYIFMNNDPSTQ